MPPSDLNVQPHGPLPINRPIHLVSGPFANRTVRAELDELQKADLGRKCGNKDRRPLDPPPVVRLKLFEIVNEGTPNEAEHEISDGNEAMAYGFTCLVDLFPWPPESSPAPGPEPPHRPPSADRLADALPSLASLMLQAAPGPGVFPRAPSRPFAPAPTLSRRAGGGAGPPREVAAVVNGVPIPEHAKCTHAFVGATFVSASSLAYSGRPTLLFAFPDLACNRDGTFLLRYRALNLFSAALETRHLPVLAECWGGPVVVYPTKDFPGLAESTELTKYISRFGVSVNIRQGERRKRARCDGEDGGGPSTR